MKKVLFRQPIHLNISNKGKLRKLEKHIQQKMVFAQNLLLTPHQIIDHTESDINPHYNHHFYLKHPVQHPHRDLNSAQSPHKYDAGSFRAIHTACNDDSLKGFPLRSITAIKPFRRGIRFNNKINNKTIKIAQLTDPRFLKKYMVAERGRGQSADNTSNQIKQQKLTLSYHQPENQQFQQFYKYKHPMQIVTPNPPNSQILSGVRILPFKKYKIREIKGVSDYSSKIHSKVEEAMFEICRF